MFNEINALIDKEKKVDLMLVIGTRAEVFPAARFVTRAGEKGAVIAIINLDEGEGEGGVRWESMVVYRWGRGILEVCRGCYCGS